MDNCKNCNRLTKTPIGDYCTYFRHFIHGNKCPCVGYSKVELKSKSVELMVLL